MHLCKCACVKSSTGFWQNQWLMKFNTKKCFSMTITHKLTPTTFTYDMGGVPLQFTDNHTYLGVLLNSKLNWNQHINKTATKANKTLGLLRRNFNHCSTSVKSTAYKTLVRPQLEYFIDPHHQTSIDRIEAVQNRAARFALGDYSRESSVTSMKYNLEWDLLEERRLRAHLLLLYKAANQTAAIDITKFIPDNDQTHRYRTRQTSSTSYKRIPAQKDCYKFSFLPLTTAQWNSLPASIRQSPTRHIVPMARHFTAAHYRAMKTTCNILMLHTNFEPTSKIFNIPFLHDKDHCIWY